MHCIRVFTDCDCRETTHSLPETTSASAPASQVPSAGVVLVLVLAGLLRLALGCVVCDSTSLVVSDLWKRKQEERH